MDIQNLKQKIGNSKALIKGYRKKLSHCENSEIRSHLEYKLCQEELKLESYELLLCHYQKVSDSQ